MNKKLSSLLVELNEVPEDDVKYMEKILPKVAGRFYYGDSSTLLGKIAKELQVKPSVDEQILASHELMDHLNALNIVSYRPEVLRILKHTLMKKFIPHRILNYFDPNDYHDRFLFLCGKNLLEGDWKYVGNLVKLGYEHIVWTNICDRAIDNLIHFRKMEGRALKPVIKIEKPDYPLEFFSALNYLEQCCSDVEKGVRLENDLVLEDMIKIGKLEKVGFASINKRSLYQYSLSFLDKLDAELASLIELNYLDREIDNYIDGLNDLREFLRGFVVYERLKELKRDVEIFLEEMEDVWERQRYGKYVYGRLSDIEERVSEFKKSKIPSKREFPKELQEYWSILARRSKKYLGASIVVETICHVAHEFPYYVSEYEFEDIPSPYGISEFPSKDTITILAKKFNLSPSSLKSHHLKTSKICRRNFMR